MTTKTLAGPKIKTALPGPNAKRVLAGDDKYISPSYTRSYPLVAKSGRGIVVTDVDGNEFFDFSAGIAGFASAALGHLFTGPARTWTFIGDVAYSPVNRNSACHGPSPWTTSQ